MRLCIVQPSLNTFSETFLAAHAAMLPAEVTVVHGIPPQLGGCKLLGDGLAQRAWRKLAHWICGGPEGGDITLAYLKAFRRIRPQAVLAEYGTMGTLVHEACRAARIPLVVHFHGFDASKRDVLEQNRNGYSQLFQESGAIIAVSQAMRTRLISLGAPPGRTHYNPCGVDCDQFAQAKPAENPPVLLSVGRFVEKKAPHLTILAFDRAARTYPDARLRMIGDGALLGVCQDLVNGLGIAEKVKFLGPQPHQEVAKEMRAARAFVQHSVEATDGDCEGTPVSVLEAGASGLPVIATRHGGIADVILDGQTGFLCEERDVEGMSQHMKHVLRDPDLAKAVGAAARSHVLGHYSMDRSIQTLWRVIQQCASPD